MDLRNYYLDNVSQDEYYYRFFELIDRVNYTWNAFTGVAETNDFHFEVYDEEEAIKKFRELCQPGMENNCHKENDVWFYVVLFYLYKNGYQIKEFPRILERPPASKFDFIYTDIRNYLIERNLDDEGTVKYDTRRKFVAKLNFVKRKEFIELNSDLDKAFKEISTRGANFSRMEDDEKLENIVNLIEHYLKQDSGFKKLDYSKMCIGFLTDDCIKEYRHKMQCFRHSSEKSIQERRNYTEEQKRFLVSYGILILNVIHELTNNG